MRVPQFNRHAIVMIATLFYFSADVQITAAERNEAIQSIAKQIAGNYIYPEIGGQIASHIQSENFKGAFNKATNWKEFDELVTKEIWDFSKDGHLYVRNNPEVVSELKDPSKSASDKSHIKSINVGATDDSAISESKVLTGNIGYLKLTEINIRKSNLDQLYSAMKKMDGTKALIIDLRDNGGGGSEVGPVLESYFLPAGTPLLQFTSRDGNYSTDSAVSWLKEKKYDKPVYIIVNRKTASAAEAFAFVLQQNGRAKIIGERSAGAAFKNEWYAIDEQNFVSVSTAAPSLPGKDVTWEQTGVQPDIKVKKSDPLEVAISEAAKV